MFHIITDTHFGHESLKTSGLRPNDFEEQIVKNWLLNVAPNDTVIHLGDLGLTNDANTLRKILSLTGRKILLRGNHDKNSPEYYMDLGIDFCCDEICLNVAGVKILFTHRPNYNHSCDINIHGHHHNIHYPYKNKLFLPVALEVMGYAPIPIDKIFEKKLIRLVTRYYQLGKIPTPVEIKSFGKEPLLVLRNVDAFGEQGGNHHENVRLNRTFFELYSQIENFDNFILRSKCLQTKKDFIHGKISLTRFKRDMENIKKSCNLCPGVQIN